LTYEDVCVLIPTLNEAGSIGSVIDEFRGMGFENILVIDGHSTDETVARAKAAGAKVVLQSGSGKGQALKDAFCLVKDDYIVLIDGDGTYLPSDVHLLLDPVMRGEVDQVVGNRFGNLEWGALNRLNMFGNRFINFFFRLIYRINLSDILSGYRAFATSGVRRLDLSMTGFEIESEITIDSVKKGLKIVEVPITYRPRSGGTKTKLNPFKDGLKIILTIYRMAKTQNPMFYFGLLGSLFGTAGFLTGLYVLSDWLRDRTEHLPLTILTAILIIVGIQLFLMGLVGDMMATMHREMLREFYRRPK
jgi:dolichol-phosphate hexosyltransferase